MFDCVIKMVSTSKWCVLMRGFECIVILHEAIHYTNMPGANRVRPSQFYIQKLTPGPIIIYILTSTKL